MNRILKKLGWSAQMERNNIDYTYRRGSFEAYYVRCKKAWLVYEINTEGEVITDPVFCADVNEVELAARDRGFYLDKVFAQSFLGA